MNLRGKFWPQRLASIIEDPWVSGYEGRFLYDEDKQALYYASATEWVKLQTEFDLFDEGQKLLFVSQPLPTGWNIDTVWNDRSVLITTTGSQVGGTGGSWTITGMVSNAGHDHYPQAGGMGNPTSIQRRSTSDWYTYSAKSIHTHYITVDGAHTHTFDGQWRPSYVKVGVGVHTG